jgi:methylated-DNA-protein-cysteine methyltransferase-like protein
VSFARRVWRFVRRIPRGRVVTYGQIAERLGRPRGARAVGHAMRECPHDLPWHRVVNAAGGISPRARMSGMITQRLRLEAEGIRLRGGRVSLTRYRWGAGGSRQSGSLRNGSWLGDRR